MLCVRQKCERPVSDIVFFLPQTSSFYHCILSLWPKTPTGAICTVSFQFHSLESKCSFSQVCLSPSHLFPFHCALGWAGFQWDAPPTPVSLPFRLDTYMQHCVNLKACDFLGSLDTQMFGCLVTSGGPVDAPVRAQWSVTHALCTASVLQPTIWETWCTQKGFLEHSIKDK